MPPKSQKPPSGRGKAGEETKEDPLQAVVIADTFETKFAPFTLEKPRCLLPLVNTPLIEYTLEFLASAGVQEVYIYAGAHVDQVETYINASRWKSPTSPFKIVVFLRCVATSVGDVMRDLDQKHIIAGDFINVSGDIVCNFPIESALRQHKARREKDKNAIMTMLLREADQADHQDATTTIPTFVIDATKARCLHYEEGLPSSGFTSLIDPDFLKSAEIDVRQDLIDCKIDICTPDVLSLWSDNFDNQAPRRDFLYGVLKDYELNGKTFHVHIIEDHYASRVGDLLAYSSISHDLSEGLIASLSIENNVFPGSNYQSSRQGPIRESGVTLPRPRTIDANTIVGADTAVGARSKVSQSVLGQRCSIGQKTIIEDSYIWNDVVIGDNVKILRAIIGNETHIGNDCVIGEGALVSFGVRIAPGTNIPAGTKITKAPHGNSATKHSKEIVGIEGEGYEYNDDQEDYPDSGPSGLIYQRADLADSSSTLASEISQVPSSISGSRSQSFATALSDDDPSDRFQHDTVSILLQRMQEGKKADDMLSELMGLRFSGGADETQVRKAVAVAMMKHIHSEIEAGVTPANASRKVLNAYHTLIRRPHAAQSTAEQVSFLLEIQRDLMHRSEGPKTLLFVTKDLYDLEVFGEEPFTEWWSDERSTQDEQMAEVRKPTSQFIEWLESADSESDDDEEDQDEEEEEDEDD